MRKQLEWVTYYPKLPQAQDASVLVSGFALERQIVRGYSIFGYQQLQSGPKHHHHYSNPVHLLAPKIKKPYTFSS